MNRFKDNFKKERPDFTSNHVLFDEDNSRMHTWIANMVELEERKLQRSNHRSNERLFCGAGAWSS